MSYYFRMAYDALRIFFLETNLIKSFKIKIAELYN